MIKTNKQIADFGWLLCMAGKPIYCTILDANGYDNKRQKWRYKIIYCNKHTIIHSKFSPNNYHYIST